MIWTAALLTVVVSYVHSGEGPARVSIFVMCKFKLILNKRKMMLTNIFLIVILQTITVMMSHTAVSKELRFVFKRHKNSNLKDMISCNDVSGPNIVLPLCLVDELDII